MHSLVASSDSWNLLGPSRLAVVVFIIQSLAIAIRAEQAGLVADKNHKTCNELAAQLARGQESVSPSRTSL